MTDSELRPPGRYGFQPVGGFIAPDGHHQWLAPVCGVPMQMQYAYGTLRGHDTNTYWWPIRGTHVDRARRMHLSEARPGQDFHWADEELDPYMGPLTQERRGDWSGAYQPDGTMLYGTDGPHLRWTEGTFMDVTGELVGNAALQFLVPDEEETLVYTSRLFRASGTCRGEAVSGLVFHDSMHMPLGTDFITSAYITDLQAAWVAFATEYEDGNVHFGHLVWGTDGFDIMIVHRSDGPPLVARDIECEVVLKDDYPVEITYRGRGETWIWEAHEAGYRDPIRADLPEGHRRIQGWAHQEGETRRPVMTEALMEPYLGRLTDVIK